MRESPFNDDGKDIGKFCKYCYFTLRCNIDTPSALRGFHWYNFCSCGLCTNLFTTTELENLDDNVMRTCPGPESTRTCMGSQSLQRKYDDGSEGPIFVTPFISRACYDQGRVCAWCVYKGVDTVADPPSLFIFSKKEMLNNHKRNTENRKQLESVIGGPSTIVCSMDAIFLDKKRIQKNLVRDDVFLDDETANLALCLISRNIVKVNCDRISQGLAPKKIKIHSSLLIAKHMFDSKGAEKHVDYEAFSKAMLKEGDFHSFDVHYFLVNKVNVHWYLFIVDLQYNSFMINDSWASFKRNKSKINENDSIPTPFIPNEHQKHVTKSFLKWVQFDAAFTYNSSLEQLLGITYDKVKCIMLQETQQTEGFLCAFYAINALDRHVRSQLLKEDLEVVSSPLPLIPAATFTTCHPRSQLLMRFLNLKKTYQTGFERCSFCEMKEEVISPLKVSNGKLTELLIDLITKFIIVLINITTGL